MGEMGGEGVEMTKKRRKKRRKKKKERKRRRRRRREIKENTRKQGSPSEMSSPFVKSWLCYSNFLSSFYSPLFINAPLYPYPLISYSISFCIRPPPSPSPLPPLFLSVIIVFFFHIGRLDTGPLYWKHFRLA